MKTLTVALNKLFKYCNHDIDTAKDKKIERLEKFKNDVEMCKFDGKRYSLLDEIIFKTVNTGVYYAKAKTILDKCGAGRTTLALFNKHLKKTKQYIIARYRAAGCNFRGLVYIDTQHAKFYDTMQDLFGMDSVAVDLYLNQKEKIENEIIVSEKDKQQKAMDEFSTNKNQQVFFNFLHEMPSHNAIKKYAYKLALKISDSKKALQCAVKAIKNIMLDLNARNLVLDTDASIVKVFTGAYTHALNQQHVPGPSKEKYTAPPAPLYDWRYE